jgi:hypothetical protein
MGKGRLRIQVQSVLQLGRGLIVSTRHLQQVSQVKKGVGTKPVQGDLLLPKLDGLIEVAQYPG